MMNKNLYETANILMQDHPTQLSVFSNLASLIYLELPDLNWVGFYLNQGDTLILGPFMGKPATTQIPFHRGVCGECVRLHQTVYVPDVHLHPDHIACDEASNSELVIPLISNGILLGVLDIDSPIKNRFDVETITTLEKIVEDLVNTIDNIPFFK
jgi:L-methionine (R)-S-oxide reductase